MQRQRLLRSCAREPVGPVGEHGRAREPEPGGHGLRRWFRLDQAERGIRILSCLDQQRQQQQQSIGGACEPDRTRGFVLQRPAEGAAQVVQLRLVTLPIREIAQHPIVFERALELRPHRVRVAHAHCVAFARRRQPFERVHASGLEQVIAWRIAAGGRDQRAVDQIAQQIDHGPFVQFFIGHDRARELERKTAGEHTQAAEHRLLLLRQQAMTPLEGREQRLLTRRRQPVARDEQAKALIQMLRDTLRAEQRHARRGQFDAERNTIEAPADVDHRSNVVVVQRKAAVDRGGTIGKQRHGTVFERLLGTQRSIGKLQRAQPINALVRSLERQLARQQQAHARGLLDHRVGDLAHALDHVFGVVDHEQQRQWAQGGG